eukprot:jgi/Mesen1/5204/ME000258S04308
MYRALLSTTISRPSSISLHALKRPASAFNRLSRRPALVTLPRISPSPICSVGPPVGLPALDRPTPAISRPSRRPARSLVPRRKRSRSHPGSASRPPPHILPPAPAISRLPCRPTRSRASRTSHQSTLSSACTLSSAATKRLRSPRLFMPSSSRSSSAVRPRSTSPLTSCSKKAAAYRANPFSCSHLATSPTVQSRGRSRAAAPPAVALMFSLWSKDSSSPWRPAASEATAPAKITAPVPRTRGMTSGKSTAVDATATPAVRAAAPAVSAASPAIAPAAIPSPPKLRPLLPRRPPPPPFLPPPLNRRPCHRLLLERHLSTSFSQSLVVERHLSTSFSQSLLLLFLAKHCNLTAGASPLPLAPPTFLSECPRGRPCQATAGAEAMPPVRRPSQGAPAFWHGTLQ